MYVRLLYIFTHTNYTLNYGILIFFFVDIVYQTTAKGERVEVFGFFKVFIQSNYIFNLSFHMVFQESIEPLHITFHLTKTDTGGNHHKSILDLDPFI